MTTKDLRSYIPSRMVSHMPATQPRTPRSPSTLEVTMMSGTATVVRDEATLALLDRVEITPDNDEGVDTGFFLVSAIWRNVDRPNTGGTVCCERDAHRLAQAIGAGFAYFDGEVVEDVNGHTYVKASRRFMGRYLNADLKALGF